MKTRLFYFIFLLAGGGMNVIQAQHVTSVSGIVRDSISGETLPYVSIIFKNSTIGAMSDDDGRFELQNDRGLDTLSFYILGYETKDVALQAERKDEVVEVRLSPLSIQLSEVIVKPKRERYSRRDNPAVELVKKVIERKDSNRIVLNEEYQAECYRKLTLSLDKFDMDFDNHAFLSKFKFVKNYLDTSEFDGKPILPLSLREELSDVYYRKNPKSQKVILKARRQTGVDKTLDEYGTLSANLDEMLQEVNVFDDNIHFLLNRFVSPLSSALAVAYYHYYIMDTLDVGGERCVDLAFVPANSQSYSFTGRMYVTLDGTYAVKKIRLNIPYHINLNYVKDLRIEQEFKRMPDGLWALDKDNTNLIFYFINGGQQLYAHQLRSYDDYQYRVTARDSVFGLQGDIHTIPGVVEQPDLFWTTHRHVPIKEKENAIDNLLVQLRQVPVFNVFIKTIEILVSGFIPVNENHAENKVDFGPMNTTFSSNEVEGFRMRAGGYTTAHFHPHIYLGGYAAYGMNDRKWKYHAQMTYSFNKKEYHEKESPVNNLIFMHEYDIYTPGQDFLFTSKDNMFVAWKVGKSIDKMNYLRKNKLLYEKEWLNGLTVKTWMQHQNNEAAGSLRYILRRENFQYFRQYSINTVEWGGQLRFAPHERAYNSRLGKASLTNLSKDAPVFLLSHQMGFDNVPGGQYKYNHSEASVSKRIWLSSFGHIDANVKAGKIWDKVPFPLLIIPNTNQSITIQPETFHMMNALEFVADQYVSVDATYYLKGWMLNRIPLVNLLQLREVVSFSGIYGNLSNRNNPAVSNNLFLFPEGTSPLGNKPYMEFSFGLENIFRILQVNYYRRLSYLDNPGIRKNGFRIALRFSF
ncbi:MAG: DUF5686 and carboxypeptidase regulatory-like domain-containing protein [Tannerella sp.]|nr:DUF5686 and carboxypeptidase regulatory-like domain-containing protein [Tannerella sp.]